MHHSARLLCLLFGASLSAQTVWTIPDGHALDPYIAQASPGDLLVLGTSHPPFMLDKGLALVGRGSDPIAGTVIGGFSPVSVAVPPGQRASITGVHITVYSWTSQPVSAVVVQGGEVSICDSGANNAITQHAGELLLQRVEVWSGGVHCANGLCLLTDAVLRGTDCNPFGLMPLPPTPGLRVGPGGRVIATHVSAIGGRGDNTTTQSHHDAANGATVLGVASLADCTLRGGSGGVGFDGGVALSGGGGSSLARTTLTDDPAATTVSNGYQGDAGLLGMSAPTPPTRGGTFQATAIAGVSQDLFGIVAGLDRTANTLPGFAEPLFGLPAQLVALAITFPAGNAVVPANVAVPNIASVIGVELWLQAVQVANGGIRTSPVAGGTIR